MAQVSQGNNNQNNNKENQYHQNNDDNFANDGQSNGQPEMKKRDDEFETNWDKIIESFEHMSLSENLLRGIYSYGWDKPSGIQQRAIMPTILGHDIIAQAQSGTGKTGTFSIASLQRVNTKDSACQILILSPVRELARQTFNVITRLGLYIDGLTCHLMIGGTSIRNDISAINSGKQI